MGGQQSAAKDAAGQQPGDATSSSHGKGRAANNQVQLAVSPLGGVPGATAYHSSVIVNGDEYFFSDGGISFGSGLQSHKNPQNPDSKPEVFDMGMSPYTGTQMKSALERFFHSGTYDLLRKNCNSFSDCALFYLLHKRLDKKYRAMEKLDRALLVDMDGYSSKKRAEDGICRLSLDAPHRLQQRSISASKLESMKQEAEMAKEWGKQDTLASRSWGGPKYRHVPPQDGQSADYQKSMRKMQSIASEISTKQASVDKAMQEDYRMVRNTRADTTASLSTRSDFAQLLSSSGGWLEVCLIEARPVCFTRIPFLGISEAKTLRLGAGIWSQRSETDLLGTYNFRSVGREGKFNELMIAVADFFLKQAKQKLFAAAWWVEMKSMPALSLRQMQTAERWASAMGIVQAASGGQYQPNPKAEGFDVEKVCDEIDPDKVWKTPGQATGGATVNSAEAMRAARLAKLGAGPGAGPGSAPSGGYAEGQPGGAQPAPSAAAS
eukprot:s227_g22.t1